MTSKLIIKLIKDARKSNTRKSKRPNITPYGKSYIDLMPEDVLYEIFKTKHSMEFASTLDMINKFKYVHEDEPFKTRIPIKTLLSPVTKRKLFHIDVEQYEGEIEFKATKEMLKSVEKQYNVIVNLNKPDDPLNMYSYSNKYTDAKIKWRNANKALVLDIICITKALEIRCASSNYVLNALLVEDLNRKKDDITFNFVR